MDDLLAQWHAAETAHMTGWDFSALRSRYNEDEPPWDFQALCREALRSATSVLDMGTGGGERLLALAAHLPGDTVATEGWEPNLPVATAALAPHGIAVLSYDAAPDELMPFPAGRFDLIMNRHESCTITEVARTLRPGGLFLTQQVGADNLAEARALFGDGASYPEQTLAHWSAGLTAAGLSVATGTEWHGQTRFDSVTTLIHYLRLVPWEVPDDFTVDRYLPVLKGLYDEFEARGRPITFTSHRFWVRASAPGGNPVEATPEVRVQ